MLIDFAAFGLGGNLGFFAAGALLVWLAGTRLARCADEIAERTGLGRAFIGFVLLAAGSSLPETTTIVTAVLRDDPALAVNDLLGSIVLQTTILALVDLRLRRGALTSFTPRVTLLLEGVFLVGLLSLVLAAMSAGPLVIVAGVSVWTALLLASWITCGWLLRRTRSEEHWQATNVPDVEVGGSVRLENLSTLQLIGYTAGSAAVILASGWAITQNADILAEKSGLGSSFVGSTLLALSTSLPELSTTFAAMRLRAYEMAVANIFGSNMVNVALLFVADAIYQKGPILEAVGDSASFVAAVGVLVTAIYLVGLIERSDRTVGRVGIDSAAVLVVYVGFLVVSYLLR